MVLGKKDGYFQLGIGPKFCPKRRLENLLNTVTPPAVRFKLHLSTLQAPVIYKYFLSTALAANLFGGGDHLCNFDRRHYDDKDA